jgi:hypothetical protein
MIYGCRQSCTSELFRAFNPFAPGTAAAGLEASRGLEGAPPTASGLFLPGGQGRVAGKRRLSDTK